MVALSELQRRRWRLSVAENSDSESTDQETDDDSDEDSAEEELSFEFIQREDRTERLRLQPAETEPQGSQDVDPNTGLTTAYAAVIATINMLLRRLNGERLQQPQLTAAGGEQPRSESGQSRRATFIASIPRNLSTGAGITILTPFSLSDNSGRHFSTREQQENTRSFPNSKRCFEEAIR